MTIDGPAASGKSTTARRVARTLGWLYLDTGAMYRSMAVKVLQEGIALEDAERIGRLAEKTRIELMPTGSGTRVLLDGTDVTSSIRTPEIDGAVGPVCEVPRVREILVQQQRRIGGHGNVVAEGRDMGTVVFPDADVKFFMVASLEQRAERRLRDMSAQGIEVRLTDLKEEISKRDDRDSRRSHSPLKQAEDAFLLDTTTLSVDEQVSFVIEQIRCRGGLDGNANHRKRETGEAEKSR